MKTPQAILASKKPEALRRYMEQVGEVRVPASVKIPTDPREALLLGMRIARKIAYEDGLVDGVTMGVDVMSEVLEAYTEVDEDAEVVPALLPTTH